MAGQVAVNAVVPVNEEAVIGKADFVDDRPREQAAFEACRVGFLAAAFIELRRGHGVVNGQGRDEAVLPVERAAVVVEAAALNHAVTGHPLRKVLEGARNGLHVVVHKPEPVGAQIVRDAHARREAARTARVAHLRSVHERVGAIGPRHARIARSHLGRRSRNQALGRRRVLVVDYDDAPRGDRQRKVRAEKLREQLLPFIRDNHYGDFVLQGAS